MALGRGEHTPSSWEPRYLADAVNGIGPEPPTALQRDDGVGLLYTERVHWIQGESESLKSWLAQLAVAQALKRNESVVYIDFEDDDHGVVPRLMALGVPAMTILDPLRFCYVRPDEPLFNRQHAALAGAVDLELILDERSTIDLAIIDGVTEAMATEELNPLDNVDIALDATPTPPPRRRRRSRRLHRPRHQEPRNTRPLRTRRTTQARRRHRRRLQSHRHADSHASSPNRSPGSASSPSRKDRPGWVRAKADSDDRIAVLEVTAYPDGGTPLPYLLPPDEARTTPPWPLCERILELLDTYDGASKSQLENDVEGKPRRFAVGNEVDGRRGLDRGAEGRHRALVLSPTDLVRGALKDGTR